MEKAPSKDCNLCPRLVDFRNKNSELYPNFFNGAVPSFGDLNAELLIVGLAPGLKGANATGRPFTGDYAGDVLYESLLKAGYTKGHYAKHAGDGLELVNCRITNVVRCVPPENKPETSETNNCNPFLMNEIGAMPNLKVLLCLGGISHKAMLKALGYKQSAHAFSHGAIHNLSNHDFALMNVYHCSRYNINTGRLTQEMFDEVVLSTKKYL